MLTHACQEVPRKVSFLRACWCDENMEASNDNRCGCMRGCVMSTFVGVQVVMGLGCVGWGCYVTHPLVYIMLGSYVSTGKGNWSQDQDFHLCRTL